MLHLKNRFENFGLKLSAIEGSLGMETIRRGLSGRDQEIERVAKIIRNMGAVGISVLCYNWMIYFNWLRTSTTTPARGGAYTTSYNHKLIQNSPLATVDKISKEQLWDNFKYFLEKIVPVAEEAKVKLALHPDDPPIPEIRGVSRIFTSIDAFQKAVDLVPSEYNGITFCQGNFTLMDGDLLDAIRHFGSQNKIHFVHFRNVRGTVEQFEEVFHDEDGEIDMYEAMKCYEKIGFDGPMRPDHAPTMAGEENNKPGYETLGRLFAVGYMKGLIAGINKL